MEMEMQEYVWDYQEWDAGYPDQDDYEWEEENSKYEWQRSYEI